MAARLIGDVRYVGGTNFREDFRAGQLSKRGTHQADGNFELPGNGFGVGRLYSLEKSFDAMVRDNQRDGSLRGMTQLRAIRLEFIGGDILPRKRNFGAEKHDQPTELQPDQKQRQRGEAAVNRAVAGHADLKFNIDKLHDLVDRPGNNAAP